MLGEALAKYGRPMGGGGLAPACAACGVSRQQLPDEALGPASLSGAQMMQHAICEIIDQRRSTHCSGRFRFVHAGECGPLSSRISQATAKLRNVVRVLVAVNRFHSSFQSNLTGGGGGEAAPIQTDKAQAREQMTVVSAARHLPHK